MAKTKYTIPFFLSLLFSGNLFSQVTAWNDTTLCQAGCVTLYAQANYGTPTYVNLNDDQFSPAVNIGFNFTYYGNTYNQLVIGSNNYISFNTGLANGYCDWSISMAVPDNAVDSDPNSIFAPWQDINPGIGGTISYFTYGTAPNRVFVVNYCEVPMYSCTNLKFTSQIKLFETTNFIETHIDNKPICTTWNGGRAIHATENLPANIAHVVPGRNFPTQWTAAQDGRRWTPVNATTYNITTVAYQPALIGSTISWYDDSNTFLGTGTSIVVCPNQTTQYYAQVQLCSNNTTAQDTVTVTIMNCCPMTVAINTFADPLCNGDCNGTATVTQTNGTSPFTYNWSSGGTTATETGLCAGTYSVIVTDANNCMDTAYVTLTDPPLLTVNITALNNVTCNGANDGSATITANGGTPGYTYAWSSGGNAATENNLGGGTYTVTVTDQNGCTDTTSVTITEPPVLNVNITLNSDVNCSGGNDGNATANASGGTPGYTYAWSNGNNNQTANNLGAGTHTVTVTDQNNCTATSTVVVTEPTQLTSNITSFNDATCSGANDGDATVAANGGVSPYSYAWSSGGNAATENNLGAGTYTVTVTDQNGCTSTSQVVISEPNNMNANITNSNDATCFQYTDGDATAAAVGGTSPYNYAWSSGGNAATENNLGAGTYTVTITDDNGCTASTTVVINEPTGLNTNTQITSNYNGEDVSCFGSNDGTAQITVSGGTTPYGYAWSSGSITNTEANMTAGTYYITITDGNGCSQIDSLTLGEPAQVAASITGSNDVLCNGGNSGDATANGTGGIGGYTYNWSSGGNAANEGNLAAGTYTVTITDGNGCTATNTVNIGEPAALNANSNVTSNYNGEDVSCFGSTDGQAGTIPSGGTSPYSYAWSSGGNVATENNLGAGTYTVLITDDNGCTYVDTVTLTEPTQVNVNITAQTDILCFGDATGDATAAGSGGTGAYTYNWTGGANGTNPTGLTAGTYVVTVTDANGCTATATTTLTEPAELVATIEPIGASCNGYCDGIANLTVGGGVTPYIYDWSNGENSEDIQNLCVNDYDVTVIDNNGCTANANTSIVVLYEDPIADFSWSPDQIDVIDPRVEFFDLSYQNINAWSWTFYNNDGTKVLGGSNLQNPTFTFPPDTGLYAVNLEVYNYGGCISDTTMYVQIDGVYALFVPDAFSPNADGINDEFFPTGIGIHEKDYTFRIYNRWGELIFESNSLYEKWDGVPRAKGGTEVAPEAVYIWKLNFVDVNNLKREFVGHVTLIK